VDVNERIEAARARAVPVPWMPPMPAIELGPDLVHQHLVAESVGRQLRMCQRVLDGARLRSLAWEVQRTATLVEAAAEIARQVA
jgi:hypothetical protein